MHTVTVGWVHGPAGRVLERDMCKGDVSLPGDLEKTGPVQAWMPPPIPRNATAVHYARVLVRAENGNVCKVGATQHRGIFGRPVQSRATIVLLHRHRRVCGGRFARGAAQPRHRLIARHRGGLCREERRLLVNQDGEIRTERYRSRDSVRCWARQDDDRGSGVLHAALINRLLDGTRIVCGIVAHRPKRFHVADVVSTCHATPADSLYFIWCERVGAGGDDNGQWYKAIAQRR